MHVCAQLGVWVDYDELLGLSKVLSPNFIVGWIEYQLISSIVA